MSVINTEALSDLLNANTALMVPSKTLGVDTIDARSALIMSLEDAMSALSDARRRVSAALEAATAAQDADTKLAETVITRLGGRVDTWQTRGRGRGQARITRCALPSTRTPLQPITAALGLRATVVSSFDAVKQDGELYWVDHADHFAVRVGGLLLHGNIGSIFADDRAPEKIKDCRHARCAKGGACDYYHDPVHYPGSTDRRNFVAAARGRARGRRFGSRDTLDIDIISVTDEDAARQRDQCMHDLLLALLLKEYPPGSRFGRASASTGICA